MVRGERWNDVRVGLQPEGGMPPAVQHGVGGNKAGNFKVKMKHLDNMKMSWSVQTTVIVGLKLEYRDINAICLEIQHKEFEFRPKSLTVPTIRNRK